MGFVGQASIALLRFIQQTLHSVFRQAKIVLVEWKKLKSPNLILSQRNH